MSSVEWPEDDGTNVFVKQELIELCSSVVESHEYVCRHVHRACRAQSFERSSLLYRYAMLKLSRVLI